LLGQLGIDGIDAVKQVGLLHGGPDADAPGG